MNRKLLWIAGFFLLCVYSFAQNVTLTAEQIKGLTPEWKGERFVDGRPKVSDQVLERLKEVSVEEAWGILRSKGYQNQYEGDWTILNPDSVMTGRVVTAQYMPLRPDLDNIIKEKGMKEFLTAVTGAYQKKFQIDPEIYQVEIVDGTHEISG